MTFVSVKERLLRTGILFRIAVEVTFARFGAEVIRIAFVIASLSGIRPRKLHAADYVKKYIWLSLDVKAELFED